MREPRLRDVHLLRDRISNPEAYPFSVPVLQQFEHLELKKQVTFLVGENGSGKSTLLEAIAQAAGFPAEGGSQNFRFQTTTSVRSTTPLADALRLSWTRKVKRGFFLRAESLFNVATQVDELGVAGAYGGCMTSHTASLS